MKTSSSVPQCVAGCRDQPVSSQWSHTRWYHMQTRPPAERGRTVYQPEITQQVKIRPNKWKDTHADYVWLLILSVYFKFRSDKQQDKSLTFSLFKLAWQNKPAVISLSFQQYVVYSQFIIFVHTHHILHVVYTKLELLMSPKHSERSFYSQSGFPLRYTENSHNPGQRVHQLHNHITTLLNIDCCTSLPVSSVYLSSSHHAHCGPWTSETTCSWREVKKVSCQYLLIIHLSSEHLRSHPVGGANHSQRLLAFFLTAGKQEREAKPLNAQV